MPKGKNISRADPGKEFVKIIESLAYSRSRYDVFSDFAQMSYCALRKIVEPKEKADELEKQYMGIVGWYKPDGGEKMSHLLALTIAALQNGGIDFLGHVVGVMEICNVGAGQFFTPYHVSRMIAEMTLLNCEEIVESKGIMTMQEPASGAGGMVLAAADVIESKGLKLDQHLYVEAIDIAPICFWMTYVQLTLRGVAAVVRWGDTLKWEMRDSAFTVSMFPIVYEKMLKIRADQPERKEISSPEIITPAQIGFNFAPSRKKRVA